MPAAAKKAVPAKATAIEGVVVDARNEPTDEVWGEAELNGRTIRFNQPNPAQLIVLRRLNRQLQGAKTDGQKFFLVAQFLDAVSALMVNEEDRVWADMEVLEGRADLDALNPLILAAIGGNEVKAQWEADQAAKKTAPRRVRRARG